MTGQLVFSRDEIQNENILKLGLLASEKSGSGFKPTTLFFISFMELSKNTVQQITRHATKGIVNGNRRLWEALVQEFHKAFVEDTEHIKTYIQKLEQNKKETKTAVGSIDKTNEMMPTDGGLAVNTSSKEQNKTKPKVGSNHINLVESLKMTIEPRFALTHSKLCEVGSVLRKIDPRFMKNDSKPRNMSLLRKMKSLQMKNDSWLRLGMISPGNFISAVGFQLALLCEPLFTFIIQMLPLDNLEQIIAEITELILMLSFDEITGSMLYLHNIREGIEKFIKEIRPQTESTEID